MKKILLIGSSIIQQFRNCTIQNYHVINKGVSGLVTANIRKINIDNERYDYMFFYCGNNDLKKKVDKKEAIRNMEKYLYEFRQNFTNTHIAFLSLLTSPNNHQLQLIDDVLYINKKMKEKSAKQQSCSKCFSTINDFAYIDINKELSNQKYYYDDVHLNDEGYHKLNIILDNYVTYFESCKNTIHP
jgi:lysophospholipase L1-like esterase